MTVRVLCAGDIHIGRRASRVQGTYRSADAWSAIVDIAIEQRVDLLALSGDVIDQENKSYEALGPMQHGLARLNDAGIETVAVAGNHDHDVLVRLAGITGTERFHLLGQGGAWERYTLVLEGTSALHVDGWSFPREHVHEPPLHAYISPRDDGVPVMGLLHGDARAVGSPYASINLTGLWAQPFAFTLLGHIHAPELIEGTAGKRALYPGSPLALDPGEPGVHGVWMAEIDEDGVRLEQLPISPVHYASEHVDLTGIENEAGFQKALNAALVGIGNQAIAAHGEGTLKVVSARLRCVGRSPAHRLISGWIDQALPTLHQYPWGTIQIEVDQFISTVRPAIDLTQRAQGADPVAETARLILALDDAVPAPEYSDLVETTLREMREIHGHSGYASLRVQGGEENAPTEDDARSLLSSRAWEMLSSLVAQEEQV